MAAESEVHSSEAPQEPHQPVEVEDLHSEFQVETCESSEEAANCRWPGTVGPLDDGLQAIDQLPPQRVGPTTPEYFKAAHTSSDIYNDDPDLSQCPPLVLRPPFPIAKEWRPRPFANFACFGGQDPNKLFAAYFRHWKIDGIVRKCLEGWEGHALAPAPVPGANDPLPPFWIAPDETVFVLPGILQLETFWEPLQNCSGQQPHLDIWERLCCDQMVCGVPHPDAITWPDDQRPWGAGTFAQRYGYLWLEEKGVDPALHWPFSN